VLRGCYPAKIDDKGRLKLPTAYKAAIEEQYGPALFVTSVDGRCVDVYPMSVWEALEERLNRMPSSNGARRRYLARVGYYGQATEFDAQGRVSIPHRLRESAAMVGEVDVLGQMDKLQVWNHERFVARLDDDPLTSEDERELSDAGV